MFIHPKRRQEKDGKWNKEQMGKIASERPKSNYINNDTKYKWSK